MSISNNPQNSFPGLNGLRAMAAYTVVIQHTGEMLTIWNHKSFGFFNRCFLTGHESVLLFFVLSGFLITYLLLREQNIDQKINLRDFYKRRVLRIAPLYFLLFGLSIIIFIFLNHSLPTRLIPQHPWLTFYLIFSVFPNLALLVDNPVLGAGHLWSLGIESQFYLIWPLLLLKFRRTLFSMMASVITFTLIIKWIVVPILFLRHYNHIDLLTEFLNMFTFECLVIGGIGAWIYINKKNILNIIFHPYTQILTFIFIGVLIISQHDPDFFEPIIGIAFLIMILNVSCNPRSYIKLQNPLFDYLGKISYGIYMFHPVVIFFVLDKLHSMGNTKFVIFVYILSIMITTTIAALSYHYFELPIMQLKSKNRSHLESSEPISITSS